MIFTPVELTKGTRQGTNEEAGIDPGIRDPLTVYSGNRAESYGSNISSNFSSTFRRINKIKKILNRKKDEDKPHSKDNHMIVGRKRKRLLEALRKYGKRIRDAVNDFHFKASHDLCLRYSTIYIGKISTKGIIKNKDLKSKNKTKRDLSKRNKQLCLAISHYKFRNILVNMGRKLGTNVYLTNEYRTSKTCNKCGNFKKDLGKSKFYICGKCGLRTERDINASKNILKTGKKNRKLALLYAKLKINANDPNEE
jgi:putative transposase